jgi:predicted transcriptional regulator
MLDGSKSVELRRRRAHLADGTLCLLYASSPKCALVGAIRVAHTDTDGLDALWRRWGPRTAMHRNEFDAYLAGCARACAIVIASTVSFIEPIGLHDLRRRHDPFVTPQSYRFLAAGEYASLLNGEAEQLDFLSTRCLPTATKQGSLRQIVAPGACQEQVTAVGRTYACRFGAKGLPEAPAPR